MKVKDLVTLLQKQNQNATILVSQDEELNCMFKRLELGDIGRNRLVLYGLSGSEIE